MRTKRLRRILALTGLLALAQAAGAFRALADEPPRPSSPVQAPAQGGGGVEPQPGAPPPVEPSLAPVPARATLAPGPKGRAADATRASLRALSIREDEATVEVDGAREVLRPGSRLGADRVRSVTSGRIVLERPARAGQPAALVIVTFDGEGRGRSRVFWTADPAVPPPAEAKRP